MCFCRLAACGIAVARYSLRTWNATTPKFPTPAAGSTHFPFGSRRTLSGRPPTLGPFPSQGVLSLPLSLPLPLPVPRNISATKESGVNTSPRSRFAILSTFSRLSIMSAIEFGRSIAETQQYYYRPREKIDNWLLAIEQSKSKPKNALSRPYRLHCHPAIKRALHRLSEEHRHTSTNL